MKLAGAVYSFSRGGDLVLQQQAKEPSVPAGDSLTYDFVATNHDDKPATHLVLTSKLVDLPPPPQYVHPASDTGSPDDSKTDASDGHMFEEVSYVSATGAACTAKDSIIIYNLGDIPPGVSH